MAEDDDKPASAWPPGSEEPNYSFLHKAAAEAREASRRYWAGKGKGEAEIAPDEAPRTKRGKAW